MIPNRLLLMWIENIQEMRNPPLPQKTPSYAYRHPLPKPSIVATFIPPSINNTLFSKFRQTNPSISINVNESNFSSLVVPPIKRPKLAEQSQCSSSFPSRAGSRLRPTVRVRSWEVLADKRCSVGERNSYMSSPGPWTPCCRSDRSTAHGCGSDVILDSLMDMPPPCRQDNHPGIWRVLP